jgi:predicted PurR-regulated permease PerM
VLGIIPYLGIALCWIPAVIIGAVQGGSILLPATPWWALPLAVTIIFIVVQQIDGLFITPRIVGEAVGLHPMTVIASVLVWALLLGGLLGAILAVPLTASVKVLFQRYIWRARIAPQTVGGSRVE